jgi:hypothetical protein
MSILFDSDSGNSLPAVVIEKTMKLRLGSNDFWIQEDFEKNVSVGGTVRYAVKRHNREFNYMSDVDDLIALHTMIVEFGGIMIIIDYGKQNNLRKKWVDRGGFYTDTLEIFEQDNIGDLNLKEVIKKPVNISTLSRCFAYVFEWSVGRDEKMWVNLAISIFDNDQTLKKIYWEEVVSRYGRMMKTFQETLNPAKKANHCEFIRVWNQQTDILLAFLEASSRFAETIGKKESSVEIEQWKRELAQKPGIHFKVTELPTIQKEKEIITETTNILGICFQSLCVIVLGA